MNIDGSSVTSRSHTHPSHSETSRLLTSSLSLSVPSFHNKHQKSRPTTWVGRYNDLSLHLVLPVIINKQTITKFFTIKVPEHVVTYIFPTSQHAGGQRLVRQTQPGSRCGGHTDKTSKHTQHPPGNNRRSIGPGQCEW